jgi:uridine kinase
MEGDKLLIKPGHTVTATKVLEVISPDIERSDKYTISVGGESGAGKSEVASELARLLEERGQPTGILQMDDYFIFPARTTHRMRVNNLEQVGMYEARLDFMQCNLRSFERGDPDIYKPLSIYEEDRLTTEVKQVGHLKVLIAEGTYTTALDFIDCHVFIDRSYRDTRIDRETRARDILDDTMAKILAREHEIVREHRKLAEIVINKDFTNIEVIRR